MRCDADCIPGRKPRSVAASSIFNSSLEKRIDFNNIYLFSASSANWTMNLSITPLETSPHYHVKCRTRVRNDQSYIVSPQKQMALKPAGCCVIWQHACQTSNITGSVEGDHPPRRHILLCAIDQSRYPARCALSWHSAQVSTTRSHLLLSKHALDTVIHWI